MAKKLLAKDQLVELGRQMKERKSNCWKELYANDFVRRGILAIMRIPLKLEGSR